MKSLLSIDINDGTTAYLDWDEVESVRLVPGHDLQANPALCVSFDMKSGKQYTAKAFITIGDAPKVMTYLDSFIYRASTDGLIAVLEDLIDSPADPYAGRAPALQV